MKNLLIVVDYQNDFVSGSLGFPGAEALDGPIARRIADYRAAGDDVLFTMDTHGPDYPHTQEGRKLPVPHCIKGTPGWDLYGQTGRSLLPGDPVFEKETFPSLDLADYLRGRDYAAVELCGLVSNICVLSNAVMVKAALPQAEITVDARLTAGADPVLHQKAPDVLSGIHVAVTGREKETT